MFHDVLQVLSVGDALERFCKLKRWIPDKQALEGCKIDEHGCLVREDHHGKLWRVPGVTHFLVGEPKQFGCCTPSIVALLAGLLKQWTLYHMQSICRMLTWCSPSKFVNDLNAATCLVFFFGMNAYNRYTTLSSYVPRGEHGS
jgi:hypothetical protein